MSRKLLAILVAIWMLGLSGIPTFADGRLGVCYKCVRGDGVVFHLWSERTVFSFPDLKAGKCRGLSNIQHTERAPSALCDATDNILRWRATNDPFFQCTSGGSDHVAWLGGENLDLVALAKSFDDFHQGSFYRVQDGEEYSCGRDFVSGRNFTALRYGRNRDILDIFIHNGNGEFSRHTDRIQDGRQHRVVVGQNFVARVYGRNRDIVKLYGITDDGSIISKARLIADGRGHILHVLSGSDVGVIYGRNKDIRVRFCFEGGVWRTGYIGIGHPFRNSCDSPLNW
ncbi:hypothetical protein K3555_13600 [Leisingera sp. M527]|uniref:hypothetical protein n=1 Tax=Leisingera sp. M527 TaxID=2867014 RepID=UPI0021A4D858|nr:hypothetical protein [Leisingera sp. M527]UWQ31628.1 hypothetical protein K3555_13600 [Leisingera sp. M527]